MINYVDDALYYANNDDVRQNFEKKLSKRFHLSLLGKAKWYLGMRITQNRDNITFVGLKRRIIYCSPSYHLCNINKLLSGIKESISTGTPINSYEKLIL